MLFSRRHRDDVWWALLGCLIVAIVLGLAVAFIGSFWLGWFTAASLTLLGQSVLVTFALCFVLAVFGLTDAAMFVGLFPFFTVMAVASERGTFE